MNKTESFPMNRIPEGCKHLYGALFAVPFAALRTPDIDEDEASTSDYKFKNPRLLTEKGQTELLDKRLSAELRESIKTRTLLNPLVCRWVQDGDDYYPQLVGGDRRYRALDFLIRKKEMVTDPGSLQLDEKGEWTYTQCSADKAYAMIPCQVFAVNDDLQALSLAWAENKGRINLTEGHEIAEVMKLRKVGASDEKILEILQQDEKWLAESDSLIANLDTDTLADLLENRIDRESACELSSIEDEQVRTKVRIAANEASKEACDRKIKRIQKQIELALERKEIAEGSVADAEYHQDGEAAEEAKTVLAEAEKKVTRSVKERDETTPVTSVKDVKKAEADAGAKPPKEPRNEEDRPLRILSSKKIQDAVDYLDAVIANGGKCLEGTFIGGPGLVSALGLARKFLNNNILANEPDFGSTIKRHLDNARKMKADQPQPVERVETEEGQ
jgi:hypothetical protein